MKAAVASKPAAGDEAVGPQRCTVAGEAAVAEAAAVEAAVAEAAAEWPDVASHSASQQGKSLVGRPSRALGVYPLGCWLTTLPRYIAPMGDWCWGQHW